MSKINLPVDGSNITPNPNNLTGEAQEYQRLQFLFPRSSTGQVVFTASPSGITYNTADYSSDVNIYNKGETGMMNLLYKLYGGAGNGWIIDAGDIFTLSPATSTTLGGVKIGTGISAGTDGTISVLESFIFLSGHPVGCYYWTSDSTNPGTKYGGTWKAFTGRFLLGTSSTHAAGSTGGAETVSLTAEQNGSHQHSVYPRVNWSNSASKVNTLVASATAITTNGGIDGNLGIDRNDNAVSTTWSGNGAAHENMPPYQAEYCWHRTA